MQLAQVILAALVSVSSPNAHRIAFPGWAETAEARLLRYESIAKDIGTVATEACAKSANKYCELRVAGLLLATAWHESDFAPDVDAGRCYRSATFKLRCDSGSAHSIWQIRSGGEEAGLLDSDRRFAARLAWRHMRRSIGACRRNAPEERLAAYAGGRCDNATARKRAREIYALFDRVMRAMRKARAATASSS